MNRIRVLLADDNQSILQLLTDYFAHREEIEIVAAVTDGGGILEEIQKIEPAIRPKVIVLTGLARDDFIARAIRLGASYYMVKPFDMHLLYARLTEIAREREVQEAEVCREAGAPQIKSADEQITNLFLTLGIPAHIKGYVYLRTAVHMVLENRDILNRITKELYPGVAQRFDTSASKVERAMRHAIEVAWSRGRLDTVNKMYGYKVFDALDKPTNGEFISCVAEKIALRETA